MDYSNTSVFGGRPCKKDPPNKRRVNGGQAGGFTICNFRFTIEGDCRAALAMTVFVAYSVERIADRGAGGFGIYDFR
ncbi:MAG: hypothetical protein ACYSUV_20920, partial [Planctomycetota bacterium]